MKRGKRSRCIVSMTSVSPPPTILVARCANPHLQLPGEAVVVEAAGSSVVVSSVGPEVVTVVPFEDNVHLKKIRISSMIFCGTYLPESSGVFSFVCFETYAVDGILMRTE